MHELTVADPGGVGLGLSVELHRDAGASDAGRIERAQHETSPDAGMGVGNPAVEAFIRACERGRTRPLSASARAEVYRLAPVLDMQAQADRMNAWIDKTGRRLKDESVIRWLNKEQHGSRPPAPAPRPTTTPTPAPDDDQDARETGHCWGCNRFCYPEPDNETEVQYTEDGKPIFWCGDCQRLPYCKAPDNDDDHRIQDVSNRESPDGFTWTWFDLARHTYDVLGHPMCFPCALKRGWRGYSSSAEQPEISDNLSDGYGEDDGTGGGADRPDPRRPVRVASDDDDEDDD